MRFGEIEYKCHILNLEDKLTVLYNLSIDNITSGKKITGNAENNAAIVKLRRGIKMISL